jgi:hypothetical protein
MFALHQTLSAFPPQRTDALDPSKITALLIDFEKLFLEAGLLRQKYNHPTYCPEPRCEYRIEPINQGHNKAVFIGVKYLLPYDRQDAFRLYL